MILARLIPALLVLALVACTPPETDGNNSETIPHDSANPDDTGDSGDSGSDETGDTAVEAGKWDWLEGVWTAEITQTSPYESVSISALRVTVDGDTITAKSANRPYTVTVSEDPYSVLFHGRTEGWYQNSSMAYTADFVFGSPPENDIMSGAFIGKYESFNADKVTTYSSDYEGTAVWGKVTRIDETQTNGFTLLGAAPQVDNGTFNDYHLSVNVRVQGDYAYVAHFIDGLWIYDVSDPAAITKVAALAPTDYGIWNDVKLYNSGDSLYALMASNSEGMVIVDVTDPLNPEKVAVSPSVLSSVHTLAVDGNYAYLATTDYETGGLAIVDLTDPRAPVDAGRWYASEADGSIVHDLYVKEGVAYLCAWDAGLVLVDVNDPSAPQMMGQARYDRASTTSHSVWVTESAGRKIAVEGGEDWDTHLRIIDVDPESAEFLDVIGELKLPEQVSIHNIMGASDTTALVSWYQYGIRLVDLADPTNPTITGWANTWDENDPRNANNFFEGAVGIDLVDDRVYVADIWNDLLVYEVDPGAVTEFPPAPVPPAPPVVVETQIAQTVDNADIEFVKVSELAGSATLASDGDDWIALAGEASYYTSNDGISVCDIEVALLGTPSTNTCVGCEFAFAIDATVTRDESTEACESNGASTFIEDDTHFDIELKYVDVVWGYYTDALVIAYDYYEESNYQYYNLISYTDSYYGGPSVYGSFEWTDNLISWSKARSWTERDFTAYTDFCYTEKPGAPLVAAVSGGQSGTSTLACDRSTTDVWTFVATEGSTAHISLDTVAADSAIDLAFSLTGPDGCQVGIADDNFECSYAPESFGCPGASFSELSAGTYSVMVISHGSCTGTEGAYEWNVLLTEPG